MKKHSRAFTLIEVMVSLAVMGVLGLVLQQFIHFTTMTQQRFSRNELLLEEGTRGLVYLIEFLGSASSVIHPEVDRTTSKAHYLDSSGRSWVIYLENGQLIRHEINDTNQKVLCTNVSQFSIVREKIDLMRLELSLTKGTNSIPFRTAIYLRALDQNSDKAHSNAKVDEARNENAPTKSPLTVNHLLEKLREVIQE